MKTGQAGLNLIKQFEGCRLTAYKCPAGKWTIGYGHTAGVKEGQRISAAQAEAYLRADLDKYEKIVDKYSQYDWSQNEFDALVSFSYNVGSVNQLTDKGKRSKQEIASAILKYNTAKVNGVKTVLAGLTKRRKAEQELFLKGSSMASEKTQSTIRKGSRGEDVIYLQKQLTVLGYSIGNIDGIFGVKTLEAVKAFQAENGLAADGIVGSKTWDKLK